jgi:hypothetical protein
MNTVSDIEPCAEWTRDHPVYSPHEVPAPLKGEMWGVVAYFNPVHYANKVDNLLICLAALRRQGLRVLVVETVFPGQRFVLQQEHADLVVHVQSHSIMWQKERLLNIGIDALPASCDRIVWIDGDIIFTDDSWLVKTRELLTRFRVVQPFNRVCWMPQNWMPGRDRDRLGVAASGAEYVEQGAVAKEMLTPSSDYPRGHTGLAWAARRFTLAKHRLYDRMILGGADSFIASAMLGFPAREILRKHCNDKQRLDILKWVKEFGNVIEHSVGFCSGDVLHLWHGLRVNRRYQQRHAILLEENFDPLVDISHESGSAWQWSSAKPSLHRRVAEYFGTRLESGDEAT